MYYRFQWMQAFRRLPEILPGVLVTLEIAVISILLGLVLSFVLAYLKTAKPAGLHILSDAWVSIARNTPALLQVYFLYFGLGSLGIRIDSLVAVILGITFNNAGYLRDVMIAGVNAVPATQIRAARSLGLGAFQTFLSVTLPQVMRYVFSPLMNQLSWSVLMSSLGMFVGLNTDVTALTQNINARTFRTFEIFTIAAVIYYLIIKALNLLSKLVAWRLFRY
ncbi:amino acid ABC transporter permease [Agrobacterium deltaense]|uniref:Polar amino acid ABC transporter, inner membrane subunit n=1 Tax=Agrobacterium deltaense NCPPB 1641 TaxID=1183425 RepID=A0A1S7UAZ6_9HYPH|nr:amino acid ABC transporter permease [Agrobacterium deltaense]CVI63538.1 Polar amino acid ABC transporter, inner membrane subunit [Agrobacterium deltaense NCPPB 1641]